MFPLTRINEFTLIELYDHVHNVNEGIYPIYSWKKPKNSTRLFLRNYNLESIRKILGSNNKILSFDLFEKYINITINKDFSESDKENFLRHLVEANNSNDALLYLMKYDGLVIKNYKIIHSLKREKLREIFKNWIKTREPNKMFIPYLSYFSLIPDNIEELDEIYKNLPIPIFKQSIRPILKSIWNNCFERSYLFPEESKNEIKSKKDLYISFLKKYFPEFSEEDRSSSYRRPYLEFYRNLNSFLEEKRHPKFSYNKKQLENVYKEEFRKPPTPLDEKFPYANNLISKSSEIGLKEIIRYFFEEINTVALETSSVSVCYHISKFITSIFRDRRKNIIENIELIYVSFIKNPKFNDNFLQIYNAKYDLLMLLILLNVDLRKDIIETKTNLIEYACKYNSELYWLLSRLLTDEEKKKINLNFRNSYNRCYGNIEEKMCETCVKAPERYLKNLKLCPEEYKNALEADDTSEKVSVNDWQRRKDGKGPNRFNDFTFKFNLERR